MSNGRLRRWSQAVGALVAVLLLVPSAGAAQPDPRERAARGAAERYLAALRSERGRRICRHLNRHARRELIQSAHDEQGYGGRNCAHAGDLVYHGIGRVLGSYPVARVEVEGRRALVEIADAEISDSGNDVFGMVLVGRRWRVVDL